MDVDDVSPDGGRDGNIATSPSRHVRKPSKQKQRSKDKQKEAVKQLSHRLLTLRRAISHKMGDGESVRALKKQLAQSQRELEDITQSARDVPMVDVEHMIHHDQALTAQAQQIKALEQGLADVPMADVQGFIAHDEDKRREINLWRDRVHALEQAHHNSLVNSSFRDTEDLVAQALESGHRESERAKALEEQLIAANERSANHEHEAQLTRQRAGERIKDEISNAKETQRINALKWQVEQEKKALAASRERHDDPNHRIRLAADRRNRQIAINKPVEAGEEHDSHVKGLQQELENSMKHINAQKAPEGKKEDHLPSTPLSASSPAATTASSGSVPRSAKDSGKGKGRGPPLPPPAKAKRGVPSQQQSKSRSKEEKEQEMQLCEEKVQNCHVPPLDRDMTMKLLLENKVANWEKRQPFFYPNGAQRDVSWCALLLLSEMKARATRTEVKEFQKLAEVAAIPMSQIVAQTMVHNDEWLLKNMEHRSALIAEVKKDFKDNMSAMNSGPIDDTVAYQLANMWFVKIIEDPTVITKIEAYMKALEKIPLERARRSVDEDNPSAAADVLHGKKFRPIRDDEIQLITLLQFPITEVLARMELRKTLPKTPSKRADFKSARKTPGIATLLTDKAYEPISWDQDTKNICSSISDSIKVRHQACANIKILAYQNPSIKTSSAFLGCNACSDGAKSGYELRNAPSNPEKFLLKCDEADFSTTLEALDNMQQKFTGYKEHLGDLYVSGFPATEKELLETPWKTVANSMTKLREDSKTVLKQKLQKNVASKEELNFITIFVSNALFLIAVARLLKAGTQTDSTAPCLPGSAAKDSRRTPVPVAKRSTEILKPTQDEELKAANILQARYRGNKVRNELATAKGSKPDNSSPTVENNSKNTSAGETNRAAARVSEAPEKTSERKAEPMKNREQRAAEKVARGEYYRNAQSGTQRQTRKSG